MVKLLGLTFALMLVGVHQLDTAGDAIHRPLSEFRDCQPAWLGYALFAVLMSLGVAAIRSALRVQDEASAQAYALVTGLLGIVALTPSYDALHTVCTLAAMGFIYLYVAVLLGDVEQYYLLGLHLATPTLMMLGTRISSYGIWQKGMILYFIAAIVIHNELMTQWKPNSKRNRWARKRLNRESPRTRGKPRFAQTTRRLVDKPLVVKIIDVSSCEVE